MDLVPSAFVARPLKIVVIGAGISGIQFAHDTSISLSGVDLEIYDRNPSLGGTWYENRYPGCTCDVPSHTYQFNWAPNPSWSSLYPPAPEIHQYLEDVVDRHNLRHFMTFNTKFVLARWNEDSSKWKVVLCNVDSDKNDNGKVVVPWPGTVLHYYAATEIIRWEDFDLVYENPDEKYASFGNGVTVDGFVPDHFPWVHPPTEFQKPERNAEPTSQVLAPHSIAGSMAASW
ncbi:hypothetical protein CBS147332_2490 [Penicillium roqueforti]|nr:hypothetical protein CBS147332_2490 [Penicillium roqueforti]KAI3110007.1 hypothetical protein CBS147331_5436 [Penicillium roqueforti]